MDERFEQEKNCRKVPDLPRRGNITGGGQVSGKSVTESCKQDKNMEEGADLAEARLPASLGQDVCVPGYQMSARGTNEVGRGKCTDLC